ncbi:Fc.00g049340.m01.CDS01 [Cosmosporella sp. VM-42]
MRRHQWLIQTARSFDSIITYSSSNLQISQSGVIALSQVCALNNIARRNTRQDDNAIMGATMSVIKTLILPAIISLILFLLITYILLPVWRRYRSRYSQYLPLDSLSSQTSSLRDRITTRLTRFALPSGWRTEGPVMFSNGPDSDDGSEDGEELGDVDDETWRVMGRDAQTARPDNTRRLSRDLEEGFRDDSDDEPDRVVRNART